MRKKNDFEVKMIHFAFSYLGSRSFPLLPLSPAWVVVRDNYCFLPQRTKKEKLKKKNGEVKKASFSSYFGSSSHKMTN